MNPLVVLLADGNAFFLGMAMVIISLAMNWWMRRPLGLAIMRIVGAVGVFFVFASATPFPVWVYCVWVALWLVAFLFPLHRARHVLAPLLLLLSFALCLLELPFHFSPKIPVSYNQHVYVLGDSISGGMGTPERNWPLVLGDISHLEVTNLAQPGQSASDALRQAKGIAKPNSLVIIEIGGIDMCANSPNDQFSKDLDLLLEKIPSSSRCVMFELPLIPFCGGYGMVQRTLAKKHNVVLIPKKQLISIIGINDNTLDGLHLSQKGHDALANSVFSMLTITR